jgi:hypothetical protein
VIFLVYDMVIADLREAISMAANDSYIARLWILVIERCILFYCEFEILILSTCGRSSVLANI